MDSEKGEKPETDSEIQDESELEEFDFDGHEIDLEQINDLDLGRVPSWIDEDASEEEPPNEGQEKLPDSSELFGSAKSDNEEIRAVEEQRDAYLEALRQLQADFENYKKRVIRDQLEDAEMKSVKLMEELLPVIDNFELALKTLDSKDSASKKVKKGIELVYDDLYKVLEKQGLEIIDAEGAIFDPEFHDAVSHEDNGEHEVEVVVEVLRPGYKVRGRVVRPAMVKVAK